MRRLLIALMLAVMVTPALGGPLDRQTVDPEAKWLIHLDVERFVNSGLGEAVLAGGQEHQLDAKLRMFTRLFGFDPTKDLASVTVYGLGFGRDEGVAIFQGHFNEEHLLDLIRANPAYAQSEDQGLVIHQWEQHEGGKEEAGPRFGTFYDEHTVVISRQRPILLRAIEALEDEAAAERIPPIDDGAFFVVSVMDRPPAKAGRDPGARIFRRLTGAFLEMGEDGDETFLSARLEARGEADAEHFFAMARGALAFASMLSQEARNTEEPVGALAPVIAAAEVSQDGQTVEFSLSMETQALVDALREAREREAAKKAKHARD